MEVITKLVNYAQYCKNCEYLDKSMYEDPCHECLGTPARENSHKPLHFKGRKNSQKKHGV